MKRGFSQGGYQDLCLHAYDCLLLNPSAGQKLPYVHSTSTIIKCGGWKQNRLGLGYLTLVERVKSLEVALKRKTKRVLLSDSEEEETKSAFEEVNTSGIKVSAGIEEKKKRLKLLERQKITNLQKEAGLAEAIRLKESGAWKGSYCEDYAKRMGSWKLTQLKKFKNDDSSEENFEKIDDASEKECDSYLGKGKAFPGLSSKVNLLEITLLLAETLFELGVCYGYSWMDFRIGGWSFEESLWWGGWVLVEVGDWCRCVVVVSVGFGGWWSGLFIGGIWGRFSFFGYGMILDIYMLIERKYPLSAEVCKAMLDQVIQGG
ncbi:hypothetical protein Tco_0002502 [Tanacetum coccineum]